MRVAERLGSAEALLECPHLTAMRLGLYSFFLSRSFILYTVFRSLEIRGKDILITLMSQIKALYIKEGIER